MSNHYHQRIIVLNYSEDDVPTFNNQKEQDAWYQALGRMVAYGLQRDSVDDSTQIVSGRLSRNPAEICLGYFPPAFTVRDEDGYVANGGIKSTIDEHAWAAACEAAREGGRAFTMGAVLHSDNTWGFHS